MKHKHSPTSLLVAIAWLSLVGPGSSVALAQQPTEKVLYSFTDSNGDGDAPYAGLIMDASGNLYGTTMQGGADGSGTVYELVNSSGTYSEKVLYSFTGSNGDGIMPLGTLIMDASGNLYGTTSYGGASGTCVVGGPNGCGTVFELVNSSGINTEKVLHSFTDSNGDGALPGGSLVMDTSGNLYGATAFGGVNETCVFGGPNGCGTVFELVNSSGTYSEKVLYSFTGSNGDGADPQNSVIMDASGNLYGTTTFGGEGTNCDQNGSPNGCGTVFDLVNSSGSYSEKLLYSFTESNGDGADPASSLIMDASGNLYGTTQGGGDSYGTVFEIVNTSALSISSSLNPSAYGQSVTFTASLSEAFADAAKRLSRKAARPQVVSGTVAWSANTGCGATSLAGGQAQCVTSVLPAGDDTVTANYSGNQNAASGSISQTVHQDSTTINVTGVSPSSEVYGKDVPVTITAVLSWNTGGAAPTAADVSIGGNDHGTYGVTTCGSPVGNTVTCKATYAPNTSDAVGTYTETAKFSGDSNYTGSTSAQSGNFIISDASSTATLSSSLNPALYGQSVTFTATIHGEYGAVKRSASQRKNPAGQPVTASVTWSANTGCGTTQATGSPETATCTTSSLPVGTDTITAVYGGDANHTGSAAAVLTQTVNASNFAVSSTPTTATVVAGKSARFTVTVTPQGSFTDSIRFSCSGLPAQAACTFSPPTVSPGADPTSSDLTITTTAATASLASPAFGHPSRLPYAIWLMLPAMLLGTVGPAKPRRRRLLSCIFVCVLAGGCWSQAACGAGASVGGTGGTGGTAEGTYTITVTGTAGSAESGTTLKLIVQ